ncbi:PAS domain S-box protein [Malaciobacter mytili]|uniref:PAS domain-containing protein n=1 Tax=Malaciobacter mytili TaxID=603050 RepID=UPI003BAF6D4E
MKKVNLFFRVSAIILLCIIAITGLLASYYKNKEVKQLLKKDIEKIKLNFNNVYEENKKLSELIFFNNLLYDQKIIKLYKQISTDKKKSREELFLYLKERFYYFKSFGVKQINFYLPNNETFLRMGKKDIYSDVAKNRETLLYVNSILKEIDSIEIAQLNPSFRFLKPLLDEKLNHLGSIEIEFDFDYIANLIQKNMGYKVFFVFNKQLIQKNLFHSEYKRFADFILNDNYQIEETIFKLFKYEEEVFKKIKENNEELIKFHMKNSDEFAFDIELNKKRVPVAFIPLKNSLTNEVNSYLVAYDLTNEEILKSGLIYNNILIFIFIIYLFLAFLIIKISMLQYKKDLIYTKYDDLLKAIDKYVVMVETNKSAFITNVTQAFCDISGYSKSELLGKNINILRHPDISKNFFEQIWQKLNNGLSWEGEIKNIDKNGNSYWVKGTIFPKYDEKNKLIGYTSIRVDITDTKQLIKINNLLKEDLSNRLNEIRIKDENLMDKTKISLMGKVLDTVAHQWKNPISNITIQLASLNARILKNTFEKEELKKIHDEIEYQLKTLSITLNEFKTLFNKNTQNDKYNLFQVLSDSKNIVKMECLLHKIKITLNAKKEIYCFGVYNEIKLIITNLFKNSIEENIKIKQNNAEIKIDVIEDDNKDIIIRIIDSIPYNNKIKEFFENDEAKDEEDLNLHIAKLLIKKTGSSIWFDKNEQSRVIYLKLISKDRRKKERK